MSSGTAAESGHPVDRGDVRGNASYFNNFTQSSTSEIEEEGSSELFEISHEPTALSSIKEDYEGSLFSLDINSEDWVYVAMGKSESTHSSLDALTWALRNAVVPPASGVCLIHVFPETHFVPSPLGKLPRRQVSAKQLESFLAQEREKRREFLQKYMQACSAAKVKVDTMLIESDMVAKAILDLIPILNIRKLVLGTSKFRKSRHRRGKGVADQVLQNAPEFCEVKIICEGKEVTDQMRTAAASPISPARSPRSADDSSKVNDSSSQNTVPEEDHRSYSFACMCFKPMFM